MLQWVLQCVLQCVLQKDRMREREREKGHDQARKREIGQCSLQNVVSFIGLFCKRDL